MAASSPSAPETGSSQLSSAIAAGVTVPTSRQDPSDVKDFELPPISLMSASATFDYLHLEGGRRKLWDLVSAPAKTGAAYHTQLASSQAHDREKAMHRYLDCLLQWTGSEQQNRFDKRFADRFLQPKWQQALELEISQMRPIFAYLHSTCRQPGHVLDNDKVAIFVAWLRQPMSHIRVVIQFQAMLGLSHQCEVHLMNVEAFKIYGNSSHADKGRDDVSLAEFQAAVRSRHSVGAHASIQWNLDAE